MLLTSANFDTQRLEEANFKFKEDAPLGIIDIFDLSSGGPKKHNYKDYKQLNVISDKLKRVNCKRFLNLKVKKTPKFNSIRTRKRNE